MSDFFFSIFTQLLTFLPLAFGISISYHILRATDMTIDGSFVIGAAVFARLLTLNIHPLTAAGIAVVAGALCGVLAALIQRGGRVDPLLAGVLATFILTSVNLSIMGRPNINLLNQKTLVSAAFASSQLLGWIVIAAYSSLCCLIVYLLLKTRFGLLLRAFGSNPQLFKRLGRNVEWYRIAGFALTNALSAIAGCLTAQTIGYADVGMGLGMTLTGIGAIILGQQIVNRFTHGKHLRIGGEFIACLLGVILYFFSLNALLRLDVDPIYLKMILGLLLIVFLRAAVKPQQTGGAI